MLNLDQITESIKIQNIIFYKPGCPHCAAAKKLLDKLKTNQKIPGYETIYIGFDPENKDNYTDDQTLNQLLKINFNYQKDTQTKPQIFMHYDSQLEWVGGNDDFQVSHWAKMT